MNDFGLVSVITPSYKSAKFIGQTIESIQAQTYTNWELLITDDCSPDNSREVIQSYATKDPRIKLLILDKNSGAGVARNNSIKAAKGRYIAFCDSDDRWYPDKLEKQLQFMQDSNCTLSYTSYDVCDEVGNIIGYVECIKELNKSKIIRDNGIGCLTAIYDAEKLGKHYMPSMRKRQDWCLWIDIIKSGAVAKGFQEPLALYRDRANSISSNKVEMLKFNYEVYHTFLKKSPLLSWSIIFGRFLPYYFYKKFKQKSDYKKRLASKSI
ncbi:MAG: glycosyltransferase [Muribaculaceae bacterium]|nr:glycosyltransferase [Muribaculaceae bacterium]